MKENKTIYANCSICWNKSGYDKESLKGSTIRINGQKVILCCPCEDELLSKLFKRRFKNRWNVVQEEINDFD